MEKALDQLDSGLSVYHPQALRNFFDLTDDGANAMLQEIEGMPFEDSFEKLSDEARPLAERVLSANLASLSGEDVRDLKKEGWILRDGKLDCNGAFRD